MKSWRWRLLWWALDKRGYQEGTIAPTWAIVLFACLFPIRGIIWAINLGEGFCFDRLAWKVNKTYLGARYIWALTEMEDGAEIVVRREENRVWFERTNDDH